MSAFQCLPLGLFLAPRLVLSPFHHLGFSQVGQGCSASILCNARWVWARTYTFLRQMCFGFPFGYFHIFSLRDAMLRHVCSRNFLVSLNIYTYTKVENTTHEQVIHLLPFLGPSHVLFRLPFSRNAGVTASPALMPPRRGRMSGCRYRAAATIASLLLVR